MADNNDLENNNDDVCEVFNAHDDVIERVQKRMIEEDQYSNLAEFFKIFGNPTRLKILSLLAIEDLCVCDICEALNLNQTTVSNQLRVLRANNIVKYQKLDIWKLLKKINIVLMIYFNLFFFTLTYHNIVI